MVPDGFLAAGAASGASALAGAFVVHRRIPARLALGAVVGGLLMGYGARIAYGCNIGAYFGGIASFSLHGWIWGVVALVGTFAGILFAYIVFFPISKAMAKGIAVQSQYMNCIRHAIFSFARGEAPMTCVEFARRNIEPMNRPSFNDMEKAAKAKK